MAQRNISIFHSTEGHLGTWTVETNAGALLCYSIGYFCPICGEVWARRVQAIKGVENRWTYWPRPCNIHHGGQVLTGGDSSDFTDTLNVAEGVLLYEFKREYDLWQTRTKKVS